MLLTAAALFLLAMRVTHAGPLWRDEAAVVNLARMPSVGEIARNFPYESFPIPFPLLVRGYTSIFGTSDSALRAFGFVAGLGMLCAIWISARLVGNDPPLIALALLGLNTTFLFWGTAVRGYGLGSALIVLVFGLFLALIQQPGRYRVLFAAVASLAAVQCLVHNLPIILALVASAAIVFIVRHDFRRLIIFFGILALCLISFLPYLSAYAGSWSQICEFPISLRLLWNQLNFALGNPNPVLASVWHLTFIVLFVAGVWRLHQLRLSKPAPDWDLLLFNVLTPVLALLVYYQFLHTLNYLARSSYFIALFSVLAVALDALAAGLKEKFWMRAGRFVLAAIALIILPINAWPKMIERQTNIDIVAKRISDEAKPADLIVIAPWQYAISFHRYYHGATPSVTLPMISDLRVHRYDLFREKMLAEHPIDDVLEKIQQTLAGGHRVWIVGAIRLPPEGRPPRSLRPAPDPNAGWNNLAYSDAWLEQLSVFVREHSQRGQNIPLPSATPINPFENVPLLVVDGWQ